MTRRTHTLLDGLTGQPWTPVNLNAGQMNKGGECSLPWSIHATTLSGGVSTGVQCVELCNGPLTWWILPTRGMGLWKGQWNQTPIGWRSPNPRPVHPALVNLTDRGGLGWLNGFNELLCRCGLASQGPPGNDHGDHLTLHGRIANLPAVSVEARVESDDGTLELCGVVEETTMFGPCYRLETTYRTVIGSSRLQITDVITNLGAKPVPLSLLYHINIGQPFLEAGSTVTVPGRDVVPRDDHSGPGAANWYHYAGPVTGFAEEAYYFQALANDEGWCTAVLANAGGDTGLAVRFRTAALPWFTVWKNTMALEEGYVTGIEPGVNLPNFRAYERDHGRLPMIAAGASYRCDLELVAADSVAAVHGLREEAARCQGTTPQKIHSKPQPGWSPAGDTKSV